MPDVNHGKDGAVNRTADGKPTLLSFAMLQIGHTEQPRISKDGGGKLKAHTVLAEVRGTFVLVPFELKLTVAQCRIQRACGPKVPQRILARFALPTPGEDD